MLKLEDLNDCLADRVAALLLHDGDIVLTGDAAEQFAPFLQRLGNGELSNPVKKIVGIRRLSGSVAVMPYAHANGRDWYAYTK